MSNEADTCRKFVVPKLQAAGWDNDPCSIAEQRTVTDGRVIPVGKGFVRKPPKRLDYLLRYTRDFPLAVVEAKASYKSAADAVQQARTYAEMLGLKFAYATNGRDIIEIDYFKGTETRIPDFPKPEDLWRRYQAGSRITAPTQVEHLLAPYNTVGSKTPRYYQQIAINRTVEAILGGKRRLLLTMATGTGKTTVAFQICWKLWSSRWNATGEHRKPRILFLADRNILIDDPKDKDFSPFGDARHKIESGDIIKSREMYFAIYQALAEDERRAGLFREYPPDFFDLVIVDECHRGSARDASSWRVILEHFKPAYQLGMTATPLREESRDTYLYFGNPLYEYSLRQGIDDGFLAPYRVHRVVTQWDAAGWRPSQDELDRYGRAIPDDEYQTRDFERVIALRARTQAIARHLTDFLKANDRFAKTIVFCVDQEHASEMREALVNLNADLVAQHPDYVCRVTADEGAIGRGHLSNFQDLEKKTPVILTSSQLLTTGVDAPTCKNVVLARIVGSMSEFKQIIGRGTRLYDGKDYFTIYDFVKAHYHFSDPEWDGEPLEPEPRVTREVPPPPDKGTKDDDGVAPPPRPRRVRVTLADGKERTVQHMQVTSFWHPDGTPMSAQQFLEMLFGRLPDFFKSESELRAIWSVPETRKQLLAGLAEKGFGAEQLAEMQRIIDAEKSDIYDVLAHVAYALTPVTREARVARAKLAIKREYKKQQSFLDFVLAHYVDVGVTELDTDKLSPLLRLKYHDSLTDAWKELGKPAEVGKIFVGFQKYLYQVQVGVGVG